MHRRSLRFGWRECATMILSTSSSSRKVGQQRSNVLCMSELGSSKGWYWIWKKRGRDSVVMIDVGAVVGFSFCFESTWFAASRKSGISFSDVWP